MVSCISKKYWCDKLNKLKMNDDFSLEYNLWYFFLYKSSFWFLDIRYMRFYYKSKFLINLSSTILLDILLRGDFLNESWFFLVSSWSYYLIFLLKQDLFFVLLWFFLIFYLKKIFTIWIMSFGIQMILSFMTWFLCIYGLHGLKCFGIMHAMMKYS